MSRVAGALAAALAAALLAGASLALVGQVSANDCGAACRNAYNQCRIATKNSPSCEAAYTNCLQRCRK